MALAVVVTPTDGFSQGAQVAVGTREPQQQVSDAVLDVPVGVPDLAVVVDPGGAPYRLRVAPTPQHQSSSIRLFRVTRSGSPSPLQMWACSVTILKVAFSPPPPIRIVSLTGRRRVRHGIGLTAQLLRLIQAVTRVQSQQRAQPDPDLHASRGAGDRDLREWALTEGTLEHGRCAPEEQAGSGRWPLKSLDIRGVDDRGGGPLDIYLSCRPYRG